MLGAIYIGLSGMEAYSQGLQTISNNVANLDTLGYKSQTVSFNDVFSEGGDGLNYTGSEGGDSVGNGVSYGKSQTDFTQGTLEQTGNALDMAVQGNGFLVVNDKDGDTFYTRTGQFSVDSSGYVSDQNGDRLTVLNASNQPETVNVNSKQTNPPVATSTITFSQNLSSGATTASAPNITVYDSTGASHVWTVALAPATASSSSPSATTNSDTNWTVTVTDSTGATVGTGTIGFNGGVIDPAASTVTISTTPTGASAMNVALNFSGVTSYAAGTTSTLAPSNVNGNAEGSLSSVTVNASGQLVLNYSNSQTTVLGPVAIADFQDPQQLIQLSNGLFKNNSSGIYQLQASGSGGGTLETGQVEASNVNLTAEFGDLILIQRGFDASSQVVSASNDMIQELFGLRGHG